MIPARIRPTSSRSRTAGFARAIGRAASVALLSSTLAGCCFQAWSSAFSYAISNHSEIMNIVGDVTSQRYGDAFSNVIKCVSNINTSCPPEAIDSEILDTLPIEIEFNMLHEFLDARGQVQLTSVPAVSPDEVSSADDMRNISGVSIAEGENYKFVMLPHQALYVYVFQVDARGKVDWMFPRDVKGKNGIETVNPWTDAEGTIPTEPERMLGLPADEDTFYALDKSGRDGIENFFVVASKSRQVGLEKALAAAVKAAQAEAQLGEGFANTIIKLPLIVDPKQSGLVDGNGSESGRTSTIKTADGELRFSPRMFSTEENTVVLSRCILHLPPRAPNAASLFTPTREYGRANLSKFIARPVEVKFVERASAE